MRQSLIIASCALAFGIVAVADVNLTSLSTTGLIAHGDYYSYGSPGVPSKAVLNDSDLSQIHCYVTAANREGEGYNFGGFTTLASLRIVQNTQGFRKRLKDVTVYYNGGSQNFALSDDDDQTLTLTSAVTTDYVYWRAVTQQDTGSNSDVGITQFAAYGPSSSVQARTNLIQGLPGSKITLSAAWTTPYNAPAGVLTDGSMEKREGQVVYIDTSSGVPANSITFDLNGSLTVGVIGIDESLGEENQFRRMFTSVKLEFSNDAGFGSILSTQTLSLADGVAYQQLPLVTVTAQYMRLAALGVGSGTTPYSGLRQIQLFAPVPEPATLSLLALGGLALLRRRR